MIDVLVIGCGASGITAAIKAKNSKNRVTFFKKNLLCRDGIGA